MKNRGFTLLELMVAVFITSIVVIAAYSLMNGSSSSFEDEQERRMLEANLRNAELVIQRDLSRIGYRVPFDSNKVGSEGEYLGITPPPTTNDECLNTTVFKAFHVYKPGTAQTAFVNSNKVIGAGGYWFGAFTIIGNFTDYDGFLVSSASGTTLTISPSLTLALTASDIGALTATTQPSMQSSSPEVFDAAFKRAFKNALAVQISSPSYQWVVTDIATNGVVSSGSNYTVTVSHSAPSEYGFNGTYENALVNPIVAITYKVVDNNTGGTADSGNDDNNGKGYDLLRCYNTSLLNPTVNTTTDCQVLLHNVAYFDIYPLLPDSSANNTYLNKLFTDTNYNLTKGPALSDSAYNAYWDKKPIKDLRGVYYRIGVMSEKQARIYHTSTNVGLNNQPAFSKEGRLMMHIQGTAVIKTKNTGTINNVCMLK